MSQDAFDENRRYLVSIAYRMLGSSADAEDAVQETWIRWQAADDAAIAHPRAWLSKTLVRLCIDRRRSAQAHREIYPGTWLPEPVLTTAPVDLESIELGFLVLLERLNPLERAVLLLHEVFDYSHAEVATIVGVNEAASRQLLHRAKKHIADGRPRFAVDRQTHQRLLEAFASALSDGDVDSISNVLTEDAALYGDGGGKVRGAIRRPIVGRERVARCFVGLRTKATLPADLFAEVTNVNGWPALVGRSSAGVHFVLSIETEGERISAIRNMVNPDKLRLRHID
jgi:RNA polymerase sigma-70 factor (ECF subfamily)